MKGRLKQFSLNNTEPQHSDTYFQSTAGSNSRQQRVANNLTKPLLQSTRSGSMNIHASSPRAFAFYMIYKSFINNCTRPQLH